MKPSRGKTPMKNGRFRGAAATSDSEEVAVHARVRPLGHDDPDERCVEVMDDGQTLQLACPATSARFFNSSRPVAFTFGRVFDETCQQREVFADTGLPLVRELIAGRNGLLFTYGVTGSGKTHTMQGSLDDPGVMSRAVDVLFNSLEHRLVSRRYMVMPAELNDFQIATVADAASMQQKEMLADLKRNNNGRRFLSAANNSDPNLSGRLWDDTKVDDVVDNNMVYAVFVSYCEIYNKFIYDLLETERDMQGKPRNISKSLKEDSHGNMYVHGGTEIEVRSAKEALEVFYRGQKRRRVAQTQLNHESSRSHSVFNIRLVKVHPLDEDEIDTERPAAVSQLALVDLAGSERTARTGNTGNRLKEAGNINNSLMTLRSCIEKLRKNQKSSGKERVPYRDDKMTHLFKNYFEGIGSIKMIVCVNPRAADYDENSNVLQFAEMAQEIQIERFDPVERELAYTPARQRTNAELAYQEAMNKANTDVAVGQLNPDYSPIYSMGPPWPVCDINTIDDEENLSGLGRYLDQRIATRNTLVADHQEKLESFRQRIVDTEKELILLREENQRLKAGWEGEKRRNRDIETRLVNAEAANGTLQRRVDAFCDAKQVLENELDEKEIQLHEQKKNAKKTVKKLQTQLSQEKDRRKRSYEEAEFRGIGSRIAEMEAKVAAAGSSKRYKS